MSLDFAAAAYSPDPLPCLSKRNATLQMLQQIPCDAFKNECWAFVALSPSKIVFSVRGTRTSAQLIIELIETMTAPKKSFPAGGSVQHYFYASLDALWSVGFGRKLRELKMLNPQLPILFTGHSLGGAIASLASARFAFENRDFVKMRWIPSGHFSSFAAGTHSEKTIIAAMPIMCILEWSTISNTLAETWTHTELGDAQRRECRRKANGAKGAGGNAKTTEQRGGEKFREKGKKTAKCKEKEKSQIAMLSVLFYTKEKAQKRRQQMAIDKKNQQKKKDTV